MVRRSGSNYLAYLGHKVAEGKSAEKFGWHIKDGAATLYGYKINSNELVTNNNKPRGQRSSSAQQQG